MKDSPPPELPELPDDPVVTEALWAAIEANDARRVAAALDIGEAEALLVLQSARSSRALSDGAMLEAVRPRARAPQVATPAWRWAAPGVLAAAATIAVIFALQPPPGPTATAALGYRFTGGARRPVRATPR
jgi:hypothetical protein